LTVQGVKGAPDANLIGCSSDIGAITLFQIKNIKME